VRMGLVIYGDLETMTGGFLYDRKLVQHLKKRGDEVDVISLPWRTYGRSLLDNGSGQLLNRLSAEQWDVLLQDELCHPSLFEVNRRLKQRSKCPILSIVHHLSCCESRSGWLNILHRSVERRYLDTIDGFIFNSRTTQREVERLMGAKRPGVVAWPGGDRLDIDISEDEIRARAHRTGPVEILFIGVVVPRKGLHTLIQALKSLSSLSWRLTVVGSQEFDRPYVQEATDQIQKAGLERRVHLKGAASDSELISLLRDSQLLVVPSFYEGFGIVYIEGMGFGLPALASTGGGAREIVTHGTDGFLVAPGDSESLAKFIQQLLEDRSRLEEMSLAAYRRFQFHPSWEASAGRVYDFLHSFFC
jgi:glycosyltransferase involved in cell wall biosynthesis